MLFTSDAVLTAFMKGSQGVRILLLVQMKIILCLLFTKFFNSFIYFIPRYNAVKNEGGLSTTGAMSRVLNISFPSHLPCLCACPDLSKSDPKSPGVDDQTKPETADSKIASTERIA